MVLCALEVLCAWALPIGIGRAIYPGLEKMGTHLTCIRNLRYIFFKQLGSGLSPQSCLYFQGFRGSKLLNGFFVSLTKWPISARNIIFGIQYSKSIFMISDFEIFPITLLRQLNWILMYCPFNSYFTFVTKVKVLFYSVFLSPESNQTTE